MSAAGTGRGAIRRALLVGTGLALVAAAGCVHYHTGRLERELEAKAVIVGSGISGKAKLYETHEGRVRIVMRLEGTADSQLVPGRHAVHIHETGSCEPFSAAKSHYDGNVSPDVNPEANVSPGLGNHPYHLGDLPNLMVDEHRVGTLYTVTSRVTLSKGLTTLFDEDGSAFIIHALEDRYLPDPPHRDAPGGARIACGVIVRDD